MSIEFRQRTAGEFIRMLKRRKWFIFLPVITMTAAIGYVVYKLPSVYESKTLLTVKPPQISDKVVQPLSDEDLSQRLQSISQEVLSRSSLEPMIAKYNLFESERNSGLDTALIVDKMRKNIVVEVEKSDSEKLAAFRISYRDRKPDATRNVTSELAAKYVNAQILASTQSAETTRDFLQKEHDNAKGELNLIEQERLKVMMQNVETLPESSQGLIAQLDGLRKREDSITKEKETLSTEKGRLNDQIGSNNRQMRLIEDYGEKETQEAARSASQIEDTPAYAQLVNKRAELSAQLDKLLKNFKEKHPEVLSKKDEITRVNEEIENLRKSTDKRVQVASQSSSRKAELQKKNLELENQRIESQIAQIDRQIQYKDQELQQNSGQISILEQKINTIPNVKVALEGINSQYQSAKQKYDDLSKKINDASLQVNRESNAQGETIRVQDPANLPESPVAPKRFLLTALGAGIGLAIGLFLAALFELPRVFKIQNIEDAKHYTGLPVLASVPPLLSHDEKIWLRRSHWLRVMAGVVAAVGAIPLVAMILQATKIFERMVS
jgi:polysaccharide chain length determinant protein (PEP-CTERM system associated)